MSDLPLTLPDDSATVLRSALDRERKIDAALDRLGPLAGRDVLVIDAGTDELARYAALGARVTSVPRAMPWPVGDASVDTIVSVWSAFRGVVPADLAEADRVLRPGGRLLVVHDYGRDDVSRLRGDLVEHGDWTRPGGPFLTRRLPAPRDPLLLDVRFDRRRADVPRERLRRPGRGRRRRAEAAAAVLQRRGLPPDPRRDRRGEPASAGAGADS